MGNATSWQQCDISAVYQNTWSQKMKPVLTLQNIMRYYLRLLLYLCSLLLCNKVNCISAQTVLTQQDIRPTGNTSCQLMFSPYRVQQSLVIPRGAVLNIEAGVRLDFIPGTGLVVEGALRALVCTNVQFSFVGTIPRKARPSIIHNAISRICSDRWTWRSIVNSCVTTQSAACQVRPATMLWGDFKRVKS